MFTWNNPPSNDAPAAWPGVEYCIWQREKGASGTEHLQGYVILEKSKRVTGMKKLSREVHWESRKGSHSQAKEYVSKEDTRVDGPWTFGDEPEVKEQGKRNDLLLLKRKMDEGASEAEIAADVEVFPVWARYYKVVARYKVLTGQQRCWPVFTHVIWGAPGLGKTRKVSELAGPNAYWLPRPAGQSVWFDGYIGQEDLVIDEFYGWIMLDLLMRILDRYPMQVETKGGSTPLLIKRCFITSNVAPLAWYPRVPPQRLNALWRRLEMPLGTVEQMLVPYVPVPKVADRSGLSWSQQFQSELYADEAPLYVDELGGEHASNVVAAVSAAPAGTNSVCLQHYAARDHEELVRLCREKLPLYGDDDFIEVSNQMS